MLSLKALVQLVFMINGLHLQYLAIVRNPDMRYLDFCIFIFFIFFAFIFLSNVFSRFQHGAAVIQDKMYIYGGNHNGRYLNDLHVSNLFACTRL